MREKPEKSFAWHVFRDDACICRDCLLETANRYKVRLMPLHGKWAAFGSDTMQIQNNWRENITV